MNLKSSLTSGTIFIAGLCAVLLGLLVMLGWHLHLEALVQVLPMYAPMQYNTALCIFLSGLALLAILFGRKKIVFVCAVLPLLAGILTIIEYVVGINFGIDELFIQHDIMVRTSDSGRMAPNTAFCFVLTGVSLLLLLKSESTNRKSFIVSILSALIISFSAVALFGYIISTESTYGWGEATRMAFHTAAGFAIIGSGLLACLWRKELLSEDPNFYWLPLPAGIAILTVALCLSYALIVQENVRINDVLQVEADKVNNTTSAIFNSSVLALKRMSDRWLKQDIKKPSFFQEDAENYVNQFPQMEALAWLDKSTQLRWLVTEHEGPTAVESLLHSNRNIFKPLESEELESKVYLSDFLELESGKECFLVYIPLKTTGGRFDGFLTGVYRLDVLLDYAQGENFGNSFLISIVKNNRTIYSSAKSNRVEHFAQKTELTLFNRIWNMRLYPTPDFIAGKETALPRLSLFFGLLTTVLLMTSTRLSQTAKRQAIQLKELNAVLKSRVVEKNAELKQSELFWHTVFESVSEVIMVVNEKAEILLVNKAADGYDSNALLNSSIYEHVEKENADIIRESLEKTFQTRQPTRYAINTKNPQGKKLSYSCSVNPILTNEKVEKVVIIASDVTERARAAEKLSFQEHLYRTLIETIPHIVWLADKAGKVTFLNSAWYKLTNRDKRASLGIGWKDHIHPNDIEEFMNKREQASREGKSYYGECRFLTSNGEYRIYDYAGTPVLNPEGNITNWVGMYVDVTEKKHAEAQIFKLNEELEDRVKERTSQLEASNRELEAFSYSVSHDLRAPLRHMNGFMEALRERIEETLDEDSTRFMKLVMDAGNRMGKLIDDLLAFSRMGRTEFSRQMVNLEQLVSEVRNELIPEIAGRYIVWHVHPLPNVVGDRAMLKQVIVNLLSNAVKYSGGREEAVIEVGELQQDEYRTDDQKEDEAIIFVKDNGAGFDMAYVDKLFGLFQRLHRDDEFEGTGVGLASSKRIILRHGGRIWAEGAVNQGTTFYFSLPNKKEGVTSGNVTEAHPVG
ncbi:MAG: PAS domain S-box protein [Calditrichia bacterium]